MDSLPSEIPKYGWKVKLDHVFEEKRDQNHIPCIRIIWDLISLIVRYTIYTLWMYVKGRKPVMDYIQPVKPKGIYGVPIGGIGGGTIGRGFKGEFARFQLQAGMYDYRTADGDQFLVTIRTEDTNIIYQRVLSPNKPACALSSWPWKFPGEDGYYTGLYPRAWTEFYIKECNVKLICSQISPVIPHNYKDSSLPGAVFVWHVLNAGKETLSVTITMTMQGYKESAGCDKFEYNEGNLNVCGAEIANSIDGLKCTMTFGAVRKENVRVGGTAFDPRGSGIEVMNHLKDPTNFERLSNFDQGGFETAGCAISATSIVKPESDCEIEFALVWDMPLVQFHFKSRLHTRYYTKFFGDSGKAGPEMCHYALVNYRDWQSQIERWQNPILEDENLPEWYKSAIFNELYYISDGGSIWLLYNDVDKLPEHDPRREFGHFAYLECHEYRMYNTYDVHFYASFALAHLWPKLQATLQYDVRDAVNTTDATRRWYLYNGVRKPRKQINSVPHDLGDPDEEPYELINAYPVHDVTDWKDLNIKFVLQCYRDYLISGDINYLGDMWPQICSLMKHCLMWDADGDGMIENGSFPDQTYDCWTMTGVSAYCGGLWIAALYSFVKMCKIMEEMDLKMKYALILDRAKKAYEEKLWNGEYYNFDTSDAEHSKSIMADQLCGLWYIRACGLENEIFPPDNVQSSLKAIYENNVCKFANGNCGAVNGWSPEGCPETYALQGYEVWTGVTYALASLMISQGMREEGFKTARGIYETVYNKIGMAFETPEALYEVKNVRAVGYMRPLSIWSIQVALNGGMQFGKGDGDYANE